MLLATFLTAYFSTVCSSASSTFFCFAKIQRIFKAYSKFRLLFQAFYLEKSMYAICFQNRETTTRYFMVTWQWLCGNSSWNYVVYILNCNTDPIANFYVNKQIYLSTRYEDLKEMANRETSSTKKICFESRSVSIYGPARAWLDSSA